MAMQDLNLFSIQSEIINNNRDKMQDIGRHIPTYEYITGNVLDIVGWIHAGYVRAKDRVLRVL